MDKLPARVAPWFLRRRDGSGGSFFGQWLSKADFSRLKNLFIFAPYLPLFEGVSSHK
jgi:hypothetical protein